MRKLILLPILMGIVLTASAQSGTNSPYSQYGLGVLTDQGTGFNRGMNGVALGFREHNQVNYLNPASYSAVDSLSFIFDAGISGQITNFEENGSKVNAQNANFEYAVAAFQVAKHVGVSMGIIPFTNVGYNYSYTGDVGDNMPGVTYTNTFSGDGGFHQVYLGAGWEPFKGFSFGANISYLWGNYERTVSNSYSDSYINTVSRTYSAEVRNYKLDLGLQYTFKVLKNDWLTLGATYSPGHNLKGDAEMAMYSSNSQTGVSDTTSFSIHHALELPTMIGVGLTWDHNSQLKVGLDYTLQQWGDLGFPLYRTEGSTPTYSLQHGIYKDRHKVNLGVQYLPGERHRNFFKRVSYKAGVSYATPYYTVNGQDGPKEISVSAGFGIPIMNSYNNRSILNISGQWVRSTAKDLIQENSFRINIGFTFNERWFMKWKVE